ncbi:MAG: hypothetical protein ACREVK_01105 [Gammaproteobacteria bacterium]
MNQKTRWLFVCGALLLSAGPPMVTHSVEYARMEQAIENAKTKADHEALAAHFEQEAKMMKDKAEEHLRMAKAYGALRHKAASTFGQHCEAVASQYEAAATENLALAKLHRQLAEEAGQYGVPSISGSLFTRRALLMR